MTLEETRFESRNAAEIKAQFNRVANARTRPATPAGRVPGMGVKRRTPKNVNAVLILAAFLSYIQPRDSKKTMFWLHIGFYNQPKSLPNARFWLDILRLCTSLDESSRFKGGAACIVQCDERTCKLGIGDCQTPGNAASKSMSLVVQARAPASLGRQARCLHHNRQPHSLMNNPG